MHQQQSKHPQQQTIAVLGVNHTTAPIGVREALAFEPGDAVTFLKKAKRDGLISGGVLLSTCNRMEAMVESKLPGDELKAQLSRYLLEYKRLPLTQKKYLFYAEGAEACGHLFRLVAGYESMVRGETQIVGQVKEALQVARTGGNITKSLLRLYEKALEVAKHIRTTQHVGAVSRSAGASAVELLLRTDGVTALQQAKHLIIGAGLMAQTLIEALKKAGIPSVTLYNRTEGRAADFAGKYGIATYYSGDELRTGMASAQYIWVATGASTPIVTTGLIEGLGGVTFFDLGLPRNIEPAVGDRAGIRLFCIDDLSDDTSEATIPEEVNACIREGIAEFRTWREGFGIRDVYSIIRSETEELLMRELQKARSRVDEETAKALADYSRQLTNRVSGDLIARLRKLSEATNDPIYADVIRELYTGA